ncbi:hypothetical protein M3J09_011985 [Ascochyta lentis]
MSLKRRNIHLITVSSWFDRLLASVNHFGWSKIILRRRQTYRSSHASLDLQSYVCAAVISWTKLMALRNQNWFFNESNLLLENSEVDTCIREVRLHSISCQEAGSKPHHAFETQ